MSNVDLETYLDADTTFSITGKVFNTIVDDYKALKKQIANHDAEKMEEELTELRLRDKNPTLKDAWDQYQTLRGLTQK